MRSLLDDRSACRRADLALQGVELDGLRALGDLVEGAQPVVPARPPARFPGGWAEDASDSVSTSKKRMIQSLRCCRCLQHYSGTKTVGYGMRVFQTLLLPLPATSKWRRLRGWQYAPCARESSSRAARASSRSSAPAEVSSPPCRGSKADESWATGS